MFIPHKKNKAIKENYTALFMSMAECSVEYKFL